MRRATILAGSDGGRSELSDIQVVCRILGCSRGTALGVKIE